MCSQAGASAGLLAGEAGGGAGGEAGGGGEWETATHSAGKSCARVDPHRRPVTGREGSSQGVLFL